MANMLTSLIGKVRNWMFPSATVQREFQTKTAVTQTMEQNINLWYAMFINQPPWRTAEVTPLGLPAAICREIARPTLCEYTANITGSQRADWLNERYQDASKQFLNQLEVGLAMGGIALKPYIVNGEIYVDATSATAFEPTKFAADGTCTAGVFKERVQSNGKYYARLEYHKWENNTYTVQNKAYNSNEDGALGTAINLADVPEWADIQPETVIYDIDTPLFAYFTTPQANNVDTNSIVGMSVYGGATVDLIRRADEQWDLIRWEYKSGQRKIFMDAADFSAKQFDKRLFETGDFTTAGDLFEQFSPDFRDEALYRGLQSILKQIEFQVGLSYGTISDPQSVEKTATEIRNSRYRMFVTIDSIQKRLTKTFDTLIAAMNAYADLYNLAPAGEYTVTHDFGDSILNDEDSRDKEFARGLQMLNAGILNDWEFRMKQMNEDEATAKAALPKMEDMTDEPENEIE